MFVINYYYPERNILSDPDRDQRYRLPSFSAPIWGQNAMTIPLLQGRAREMSADSSISVSCREGRWLWCCSRWTDLDMSSFVHTVIQNILAECL